MILTKHQTYCLNKSLHILENGNRLLIKGSAGVGKTTLLNFLVKNIYPQLKYFDRISCTAPTNKAVFVLKQKIINLDKVDFLTIHAAFKIKGKINQETGELSFNPQEDLKTLRNVKYLIIDEASMLDTQFLIQIEKSCKNIKIIFVGDDKQLNPVGEDDSPVFMGHKFKEFDYPTVELKEIVRQKDKSPIIELSNNLNQIYKKQNNLLEIEEVTTGYLFTGNKNKVLEALAQNNGKEGLKYLAWTNREVNYINKTVRELIYKNPQKIEKGERLIFNRPYQETYYTNEEIEVKELVINDKSYYYYHENKRLKTILKYYEIDAENNSVKIKVIHENSEKDFTKACKHFKNSCFNKTAKWEEYYDFIGNFADIKYCHAISIHKSQGSTYNKVIININDIELNKNLKEKKRLLYTAITRASDLVILYNS